MTPPHRTNPDKSELNLVSSRMTAERRARLLVVSNRLPVTIKGNPGNEQGWTYHLSSGGLVSALSGLKKLMSFLWIGWPGWPSGSWRELNM